MTKIEFSYLWPYVTFCDEICLADNCPQIDWPHKHDKNNKNIITVLMDDKPKI